MTIGIVRFSHVIVESLIRENKFEDRPSNRVARSFIKGLISLGSTVLLNGGFHRMNAADIKTQILL
jgi:hypothetical protein